MIVLIAALACWWDRRQAKRRTADDRQTRS